MASEESVESLKNAVKGYWNSQPCGTQFSDKPKSTREYFDEIEAVRYSREPEIFSFAQFTRFHGKRLLEVGVGAGSDFTQWVRAGTIATGIDATEEGIAHVQDRLRVYDLHADRLLVADCEKLPFPDNHFDVVYSWGVIHHTPNTDRALSEIVRVCKPGGVIKVMVYHRHSLLSYFFWVKHGLLAGRPWKSLSWCLSNYMESPGTQAYTRSEFRQMIKNTGVSTFAVSTILTFYDRLERHGGLFRRVGRVASVILGRDRVGWFMTAEIRK